MHQLWAQINLIWDQYEEMSTFQTPNRPFQISSFRFLKRHKDAREGSGLRACSILKLVMT